jgi:hypothetical protein
MSQQIDDGGSAFPVAYHPEGNSADQPGMSLRDWLAHHASEEDIAPYVQLCMNPGSTGARIISRNREQAKYAYADAMLAARNRRD